MIKYNTPQELFTAICDKIRNKTNSNELINHQDIPNKIDEVAINGNLFKLLELISIGKYNGMEFINNSIEQLNGISFYNNKSLTVVQLTKVKKIGPGVFYNCTRLTTIDLPECTSIEEYSTFYNCNNLTTVNLPKCTSVGSSTFYNCTRLTTINLPECISIGNCAFEGCTSLTTVNLPKCTSIGNCAFEGCSNLTTLILNNNQIITLQYNRAFTNSSIANGTGYVYVPDNLVDSYKTATNWSTYANQIKPISELPSELKEEYGYE